ncbi:MAG: RagB/SusD family nutrient uptake outer membrane protein [Sphingobacteriaceae bacterium]|nr:MAG: RagB/SusD family nutrient uptake outer membrane protein [Sphingobacteriaceae bacterium]
MLSFLLLIGSCKKFTDLQPNNSFSEATAFTSPERVALAVTGVYSAAQSSPYTDGTNRGYPFGSANTIQGDARGEDVIAVPSFFLITYGNTYDATTANNTALWTSLYATINRANVVIEGLQGAVSSGVITAATASVYEGECRFLRALCYHELVVHFAKPYLESAGAALGVPLQLTAINSPARVDEAKAKTRNTVKEIFTQILVDLDFAETNLPATRTSTLKITRATKGAAVAVKTRVKLDMGDYAGVITEGTKLGTSAASAPFIAPAAYGSYALTASPDGVFSSVAANGANTESMFSIEHSTTRNAGTNGSVSTMYSKSPGRALIAISPIIWDMPSWRVNDLRRTLLCTNDNRSYFTSKYKDPATFTDYNPIIRYAEVILNVAEAYARTSAISINGLALLNAVRNRAVTTAAEQYTVSSFAGNGDALVQAILNERRIEFLCEGKRWFDLHRLALDPKFGGTGIPAKVSYANATFATYTAGVAYTGSRSFPTLPYNNFRFVFPIPSLETSANLVLAGQQNPGY